MGGGRVWSSLPEIQTNLYSQLWPPPPMAVCSPIPYASGYLYHVIQVTRTFTWEPSSSSLGSRFDHYFTEWLSLSMPLTSEFDNSLPIWNCRIRAGKTMRDQHTVCCELLNSFITIPQPHPTLPSNPSTTSISISNTTRRKLRCELRC